MLPKTTVTPKTNPRFAILDPTTFPSAKSGEPSKAAFILTINSGAEVAKDTTVMPITIFGMESFKDSATADFNSQFPPNIKRTNPIKIKSISSIHGVFPANID